MSRDLECLFCRANMASIRDGRVRNDIVILCRKCFDKLSPRPTGDGDVPDFLKGLFRGRL